MRLFPILLRIKHSVETQICQQTCMAVLDKYNFIYTYIYMCVFFNLKRVKLNILESTARYAGLLQGPAEGFGLWTRGWGPKMWMRFSCCKFKHFVMHFGIFNIFLLVLSLYLAIKKNPAYGRHQISWPMWILTPIFFFFIRRLQVMDLFRFLINETEFWWPSGINFFHQEIAVYRPLAKKSLIRETPNLLTNADNSTIFFFIRWL